jgi:hypothetical protein
LSKNVQVIQFVIFLLFNFKWRALYNSFDQTMNIKFRSLIILSIVLLLCTCIDPYEPKLEGFDSLLVVEGMITNQKLPYEVKLSRTMQRPDLIPEKVSDATVFINDENGIRTNLKNYGAGLYKTDSSSFTGTIGKTYTLNIITRDGKEYKSEPCIMTSVPEIDTIYYAKEINFSNNQSESHEGIKIYLDSKEGDETNRYLRWEYEETWKFRVPLTKRFNYINEKLILPLDNVKEYCWKQQKSKEVLFHSLALGERNIIKKEPICFISPDKSDRLTIQYSILIKQYSISKKESEFWDNLKKVNESGGDIFGSQPFAVISNLSNKNNPFEKVLGYFQVSAVKQKRKDITYRELKKLELPLFDYNCERIETSPSDFCRGVAFCVPPTWDELYQMWTAAKFTFVEPFIDSETKNLIKLVFSTDICSDCKLTGTFKKPDFWIDLN